MEETILTAQDLKFRYDPESPAYALNGVSVGVQRGEFVAVLGANGLSSLALLALALPLTDTTCAIIRRVLRGQSPFHPDRGHLHHRLIDMGLSQKQAVAILYSITALLGLCAVVIVSTGKLKVCLLILAIIMACVVGRFIRKTLKGHEYHPKEDSEE